MFFANAERDTVREEHPGISFGETSMLLLSPISSDMNDATGQVGKVLGDRWKALNEKQRIPWEEKAAADKARYETEKAAYQNVGHVLLQRMHRVNRTCSRRRTTMRSPLEVPSTFHLTIRTR